MSTLYQSTTESLESLDAGQTCSPRLPLACGWHRDVDVDNPREKHRKTRDTQEAVDLDFDGVRIEKRQRKEEKSKLLTSLPLSCVTTPTKEKKRGLKASSRDSLGSPNMATTPEYGSQMSINKPPVVKRKLSRAKSVRMTLAKGTLDFFGLNMDDEALRAQQKWRERRLRHCNKRYGKLKEEHIDGSGSLRKSEDPEVPRTSIVTDITMANIISKPLSRVKSTRESVPSMVWNGLKRRLSTRPGVGSHVYDGRSFAPADLDEDDDDFFVIEFGASPAASERDSVFFDFHSERGTPHAIIEEERPGEELDEVDHGIPPMPPPRPSSPALAAGWKRQQKEKALERDKELAAKQTRIKPVQAHVIRQPSERRHRMQHRPVVKKKKSRRVLGKGLVGRLLNRTIKRKRISSSVRKQLDEIVEHRPYFTYWLCFVQVVILIVMLSVHKLAPIGVSKKQEQAEVLLSRQGVLQKEKISKTVFENLWIGPSQDVLISLGAKYAPCMRKDKLLWRTITKEREAENNTGCCIQTFNTGCIQLSRSECTTSFTKFIEFSKKSKAVCGQDPAACTNPVSAPPHVWPPYEIWKWPICKKTTDVTKLSEMDYPHMRCLVTGRPCCVGTQAKCMITSQAHCAFLGGKYHPEATLCSQVDCLGSICGLLPFLKPDKPDQVYRLWLSLFLHAGILHILITIVFNFTILRDMEKMAGWLRISLIYLISGIGGNLWSAVLIPYQAEVSFPLIDSDRTRHIRTIQQKVLLTIELLTVTASVLIGFPVNLATFSYKVGPSGALFGMMACLFVELFQMWQLVARPFVALAKLSLLIIILFLVGLLPYVDNFAHIFGFIYGLLSAFAFLPYVSFGEWDLRRKRIQIFFALSGVVALTVVGCILFYVEQEFACPGCAYFNCVPLTYDFCENSHIGQKLQPR